MDGEVIVSKSGDVELKTDSEYKKGKEMHVTECIACSLTNDVFRMRLRRRTETQESNIIYLLNYLPKLANPFNIIQIIFNCGYANLSFIRQIT